MTDPNIEVNRERRDTGEAIKQLVYDKICLLNRFTEVKKRRGNVITMVAQNDVPVCVLATNSYRSDRIGGKLLQANRFKNSNRNAKIVLAISQASNTELENARNDTQNIIDRVCTIDQLSNNLPPNI